MPQEIRTKLIEILKRDISDWFAAQKLLPKKKRNREELYKYLANGILSLFPDTDAMVKRLEKRKRFPFNHPLEGCDEECKGKPHFIHNQAIDLAIKIIKGER